MKGRADMLAASAPVGSGHSKMTKQEKRDLFKWTKEMQARYPDGPSVKRDV